MFPNFVWCISFGKIGNNIPAKFFHRGVTVPRESEPPHYPGFTITLRHTTFVRTPLQKWSVRRRDLYRTTHNTHNMETSMPPAGLFFETLILLSKRYIDTEHSIRLLVLFFLVVNFSLFFYYLFMYFCPFSHTWHSSPTPCTVSLQWCGVGGGDALPAQCSVLGKAFCNSLGFPQWGRSFV
jgi:hypothetical protein